jgi:nitroreductase
LRQVRITKGFIEDLAIHAQLSPSCSNNQPWRYIFVYDPSMLKQLHEVLSPGNAWAKQASMIIVTFSKKEDDCLISTREYYLFDTGMATAFLILRATELGFVAHPIAGYSPKKTREILGIPDEYNVIALVIVGQKDEHINPVLSEKQIKNERKRPERLPLKDFIHLNRYGEKKLW